jgi:alanyl-tRNA synthetase
MVAHFSNQVINGEFAFELYDTFGFPIDLTELMAREKGWKVDMNGFEAELQKQKARSRAATAIDTGDWVVVNEEEEVEFEALVVEPSAEFVPLEWLQPSMPAELGALR